MFGEEGSEKWKGRERKNTLGQENGQPFPHCTFQQPEVLTLSPPQIHSLLLPNKASSVCVFYTSFRIIYMIQILLLAMLVLLN